MPLQKIVSEEQRRDNRKAADARCRLSETVEVRIQRRVSDDERHAAAREAETIGTRKARLQDGATSTAGAREEKLLNRAYRKTTKMLRRQPNFVLLKGQRKRKLDNYEIGSTQTPAGNTRRWWKEQVNSYGTFSKLRQLGSMKLLRSVFVRVRDSNARAGKSRCAAWSKRPANGSF